MNNIRQKGKILNRTLMGMGCLGIFAGISIASYSYFELRPLLQEWVDPLQHVLHSAEEATSSMERHLDLFDSSVTGLQKTGKLVNLLPETSIALHGVLLQTSTLLEDSASTLKQTTEGLRGLVVPKNALGWDDANLRRTATQLRLLSGMVDQLKGASADLAANILEVSNQLNSLRLSSQMKSTFFTDTRDQIRELQHAIEETSLPARGEWMGIALGGLCIYLGVCSLALARIQNGIEQLGQIVDSSKSSSTLERRSA